MPTWRPPVYRVRAELPAPLPYVFSWCTDYRPDDGRRSGERYERRVISRRPRRIVFEDLWWEADGWRWRRYEVSLHPPDRWRADSIGNVRDARIDYRLRPLSPERTELTITMHRRPGPRAPRQPARRTLEGEIGVMWRHLANALRADYRRSRRRSARRAR